MKNPVKISILLAVTTLAVSSLIVAVIDVFTYRALGVVIHDSGSPLSLILDIGFISLILVGLRLIFTISLDRDIL